MDTDKAEKPAAPMLPEIEALYKGIIENPKDDAVRLVAADWYDEHYQTNRAAFIRTQIAAAKLPLYDPKRKELEDEAFALFCGPAEGTVGDSVRDMLMAELPEVVCEMVEHGAYELVASITTPAGPKREDAVLKGWRRDREIEYARFSRGFLDRVPLGLGCFLGKGMSELIIQQTPARSIDLTELERGVTVEEVRNCAAWEKLERLSFNTGLHQTDETMPIPPALAALVTRRATHLNAVHYHGRQTLEESCSYDEFLINLLARAEGEAHRPLPQFSSLALTGHTSERYEDGTISLDWEGLNTLPKLTSLEANGRAMLDILAENAADEEGRFRENMRELLQCKCSCDWGGDVMVHSLPLLLNNATKLESLELEFVASDHLLLSEGGREENNETPTDLETAMAALTGPQEYAKNLRHLRLTTAGEGSHAAFIAIATASTLPNLQSVEFRAAGLLEEANKGLERDFAAALLAARKNGISTPPIEYINGKTVEEVALEHRPATTVAPKAIDTGRAPEVSP